MNDFLQNAINIPFRELLFKISYNAYIIFPLGNIIYAL